MIWKDNHHHKTFAVSDTFLHAINDESDNKGVQYRFGKDGKMGDWFIRKLGEWFHTDKAKAHREQLKRRGEIKLK
jgi:hypothetical protein